MHTDVIVSPAILDWVTDHARMDSLPSQIIEYLEQWRSGKKNPTFNQLEKVSSATRIPLGYFFLQTPPQEDISIVDYRTIDSIELENPSRELIDTIHDMEQIQEWMHNHLVSEGASTLSFVGKMRNETDVLKFAAYIRELLGIGVEWYKNIRTAEDAFNSIRTAISSAGIIVMMSGIVGNNTHRPLDIHEFRAFSVVDEYAPLIFINANDSTNGKLFSLLHELAHICIGENSLYNDRYSTGVKVKKAETVCNAVAAEVLVPHNVFIRTWEAEAKTHENTDTIAGLARFFKCGITVIARKAYDNGLIDYNLYREIAEKAVHLYEESRRRKKEQGESGGDYYRTAASRIDKRFFGMLLGSVREGKTLYTDAFRLTNTNRSTFGTLAENAGGGGIR